MAHDRLRPSPAAGSHQPPPPPPPPPPPAPPPPEKPELDQDGAGTHINITGAAVASTADAPDLALRFIEFLATPEGQGLLTSGTSEYPVVAGAPMPEGLELLANFKQSDFPLSDLGANLAEAQAIYDRAGWN